jgi:UDPglucose 6-dehydrogenase
MQIPSLTSYSCFQKDIFNIVYLSESLHLYEVAEYWRSIIKMNEYQKLRFTKRIITCLFNSLTNKKIAVLGFAFKKDTSDTRDSPAITLVKNLVAEGSRVAIYDPRVADEQIWSELLADGIDIELVKGKAEIFGNVYDACDQADAIVIATEWDQFSNRDSHSRLARLTLADVSITQMVGTYSESAQDEATLAPKASAVSSAAESANFPPTPPQTNDESDTCGPKTGSRLDWEWIAKRMKKPRFVFDGRNILDADELRRLGFIVESIGKAPSDFHLRLDF